MSKKVLFILMPQNYKDEEFCVPYEMLKSAGFTVDVASWEKEAVGANGHRHTPNLLLGTLHQEDFEKYDALVIPGGPGSTKYLWGNSKVQEIAKYFHENSKIVAAICYACIVPVEAGILTNKNATVYPTDEAKAIFEKHNVNFFDSGVVEDDSVITAQGPKFVKAFGEKILEFLTK